MPRSAGAEPAGIFSCGRHSRAQRDRFTALCGILVHCAPPFNSHRTRDYPANGLRIGSFFFFKNERGDLVGRGQIGNTDGSLKNHRSVVVFVVRKMHRAARDLGAARDDGIVHVMTVHAFPAERRDQ